MSFTSGIKKIKLPNFKNLFGVYKNAQEDIQKVNINKIGINYYDKTGVFCTKVYGELDHSTNIPIVYMNIPEKLGVIILDGSIYIDEKTHEKFINVIQDYPYSLVLNQELKKRENKDITNKKIEKSYIIPVMLNKIERQVKRIKLNEELPDAENNLIELSQRFIYQIGHVKVLERLDKKENDGLIVAMIIGILIGIIIGSFIMSYLISG